LIDNLQLKPAQNQRRQEENFMPPNHGFLKSETRQNEQPEKLNEAC